MKLTDLEPRWLSADVLMFRSPAGAGNWITVKRRAMATQEQYALVYESNPDLKGQIVVMTRPDQVWVFDGDLRSLTLSPSVDHSPSGNWHGWVRNGEVIFL